MNTEKFSTIAERVFSNPFGFGPATEFLAILAKFPDRFPKGGRGFPTSFRAAVGMNSYLHQLQFNIADGFHLRQRLAGPLSRANDIGIRNLDVAGAIRSPRNDLEIQLRFVSR